jgi:uncharacterized damage-inducible protein DinB
MACLAANAAGGFKHEYLDELEYVSKHANELAEAMPAAKYAWRPAKGVRSVSEVYVHMAAGNFLLLDLIGVKAPAEWYSGVTVTGDKRPTAMIHRNEELEKTVTEPARVRAMLKQSLEAVRKAFEAASDADLDKPASFFGEPSTVRAIYLRILVHLNEHTGQSVAYARMNGVVPPWSRASR